MKNLVVLTGAGVSAESGIRTFRDSGGLWEEYDVMDVASPEGWKKDYELVLNFYNDRRRQLKDAQPNEAHIKLAELEDLFHVNIITQNIDDLHERAGSSHVLHLHGELTKVRSTKDPDLVFDIGYDDLNPGDLCPKGSQLRPHVVWFGEAVPEMAEAARLASEADVFLVVGTSLNVYPAAGLVQYAQKGIHFFVVDPKDVIVPGISNVHYFKEKAGTGMSKVKDQLLDFC